MKIVNRQQFLEMPSGTVFAKYEPCVFGDLMIKGESLPECNDFYAQTLIEVEGDNSVLVLTDLDRAYSTGGSVSLDFHCQYRDGTYDRHQLFAVFESKDVSELIDRLKDAAQEVLRHQTQ